MSHEHMARGSKVSATLPVITAFAGKVRPQPPFPLRHARCVRSTSLTASGPMVRKAPGSGECDRFPARTHNQHFTTVTLYHGSRAE